MGLYSYKLDVQTLALDAVPERIQDSSVHWRFTWEGRNHDLCCGLGCSAFRWEGKGMERRAARFPSPGARSSEES